MDIASARSSEIMRMLANDQAERCAISSYLLQTFAVHTACRVSQPLIWAYTSMRARREGSPASSARNSIVWNQTMHLSRYVFAPPQSGERVWYPNAGAMRLRRNHAKKKYKLSVIFRKGITRLNQLFYIHKHSFPLAVPAATQSSVGWNLATAGTAVMPSPPSCASCCPLAV
jgi:hypothetical protein